jgi:hypothetical protein
MGDNFQEEISNGTDPEVDAAIAKNREEAPDAYDDTGALSRPSRSSRSSRPQLTEGILRDMRRHRGGGAGYSGSTPINTQQLKSEAQTRNFFDRINREKLDPNSSRNLDPYSSFNAGRRATPSEEAYLNAHGSKTESQISQDIRNELYAKDPKARADSPLGIYDTSYDTEEDKRINKSREGISHHSLRWTEEFKEFPEYKSGDFGRLYKEQIDNFVAQNPAYKNQLNKVGYAGFQVKEINPYQVMEQVMLENQVSAKPSVPAGVKGVTADSESKPIRTGKRLPDQPQIDTSNRDTWTADRDVLGDKKGLTRDQRLKELSEYWSDKEQKWITTNSFDQPKHTAILAKLAFKNRRLDERNNYLSDLKNSIKAELISRHNVAGTGWNWSPKVSHRGGGSSRNPFDKDAKNSIASQKNVDSMANDLMEIEVWRDIIKNNKSKDLGKTPEEINQHIINLKNRYNETKRHAVVIEQYSNRIG